MSRLTIFALLFAAGTTACSGHSYRIKNNNLHIYLKEPGAHTVIFLSSLDDFSPHEAHRIDKRTWEIILPTKIEFKYFYIVDGVPFIPDCKYKENDDFGSQNCIFIPEM